MPHLGTTELLIVLALVLLLFGAKKVPEMARGLGQGLKEFRRGVREAAAEEMEWVTGSEPAPRAPLSPPLGSDEPGAAVPGQR